MKTKEQIYQDTREMVNKQDKQNYLEYYRVFLENSSRHDIPTEEVEAIIADAYAVYKHKEAELEEILDLAYLDLVTDNNGYNQAI